MASPHPLVEGIETTVQVELRGQGNFEAALLIEPGGNVAVGAAVTVPGGQPARPVLLRLVPGRWGTYSRGTLVITLTDRWRLAEGKVLVQLPFVSCLGRFRPG